MPLNIETKPRNQPKDFLKFSRKFCMTILFVFPFCFLFPVLYFADQMNIPERRECQLLIFFFFFFATFFFLWHSPMPVRQWRGKGISVFSLHRFERLSHFPRNWLPAVLLRLSQTGLSLMASWHSLKITDAVH